MTKTVLVKGYDVTTEGVVFNTVKVKVIKPFITSRGYHYVNLGRDFRVAVHRMVALTYLDNPNGLPQVNHVDGNKNNNMLSNLEWSTGLSNMRHAAELGLCAGFYGKQKLIASEELDLLIKEKLNQKVKQEVIADELGCHRATVSRYIRKRGLHNV